MDGQIWAMAIYGWTEDTIDVTFEDADAPIVSETLFAKDVCAGGELDAF